MKHIDWKKSIPYWVALVLFLGFSMAYCFPLFEGKTLNAGDVNNWKGAAQEAREYKEQTGITTFWTNSMFSGMPTYQITGSTPANVVKGKIENVIHLGFTGDYAAIGLIFAYLLGFFLMLRCFKVNAWLSIAGAFALALSTYFFLIIPAGHMTKASAMGCLAPMIGGFYAIFRKQYWLGAPLVTIYGIIGIALHAQMSYYICMLLGVLAIAELYIHIREKRWKDLGIGVGILIICAAFIYGSKLSWIESNSHYLKETMRGGHSELTKEGDDKSKPAGLDIDYATAWSYGKAETLTLLIPNFMGGASGYNVGEDSQLYKDLVGARVPRSSARQFCQQVPTYWGDKAFTSGPVYVGAIICLLFILGLIIVPGAYKWALLASTIFAILLAWGRNFMPLTQLFYDYFPMYNKFRAVESILVVAEITIPLLGFLALKRIYDTEDKSIYLKPLYISAGITAGTCLLLALFGGSIFDFTSAYDAQWKGQMGNEIYQMIVDQRASMMKADAWRSLIFVVLAAGLVWCYIQNKLKFGYFTTILVVLVLADMLPVDRRFFGAKDFVNKKDDARFFAIQPWEEQILQDKSLHYRVFNVAANTFNDARTSYRLKSIGGYSAVKLRRYQDLIDAHISRNNWTVLNMLNTKYIITRDGVHQNPQALGNAWFVDEIQFVDTPDEESEALNHIDPRKTAVADKRFAAALDTSKPEVAPLMAYDTDEITLTSYAPNCLTYKSMCERNRIAVFSEIYYPEGWHLYVDGTEIEIGRVNYTLRGAVIPAGIHDIRMEFINPALAIDKWSLAILIVAIVLSLISLASPLFGKRLVCCPSEE